MIIDAEAINEIDATGEDNLFALRTRAFDHADTCPLRIATPVTTEK